MLYLSLDSNVATENYKILVFFHMNGRGTIIWRNHSFYIFGNIIDENVIICLRKRILFFEIYKNVFGYFLIFLRILLKF